MAKESNIDVKVDDLIEVIFAVKNADGGIIEYTVAAETATDLRYIEEEFVGALNSDGIMHLNILRQITLPPTVGEVIASAGLEQGQGD